MMGELAASIGHEIKQPIAAAVTNAKTCLRWLKREPPELAGGTGGGLKNGRRYHAVRPRSSTG